MKKIISSSAMADLEKKAYSQGFTEEAFMENAGKGVAVKTIDYIQQNGLKPIVWLLCGKGNNAGDAFVAGRYLLEKGYQVTAIQLEELEKCTPLCQSNQVKFLNTGGRLYSQIPPFGNEGVILDGIFGTGFKGDVKEPYQELINIANLSHLPILSIDIPSGLNGTTGEYGESVIHATETIFLGLPKQGFFLNKGWEVVGHLEDVNFGLPEEIVQQTSSEMELVTQRFVKSLLPPISRTRHKYQSGYAIGVAGSPSMPGAALLASLAALKGGSGMVRLFYPKGMEVELSSAPYELIKIPFTYDNIEEILAAVEKAEALFIGPGLGRNQEISSFLKGLFSNDHLINKSCVIDADALILYAEKPYQLPLHTIFTPHRGEMQKLLGLKKFHVTEETLALCQDYAEEKNITLILKGAPSFIFHPGQPICVNPTGDPGMATAGSGDVLTGLLASLLSQGLSCHHAAILGVYLHGLSGELAVKERGTSYGLMARDLIHSFSQAYSQLSFK